MQSHICPLKTSTQSWLYSVFWFWPKSNFATRTFHYSLQFHMGPQHQRNADIPPGYIQYSDFHLILSFTFLFCQAISNREWGWWWQGTLSHYQKSYWDLSFFHWYSNCQLNQYIWKYWDSNVVQVSEDKAQSWSTGAGISCHFGF